MMKQYVDYVYEIVKADCEGLDSVYKDYIIQLVGLCGFNALLENRLIESCGVIHGRQLYTLCEREVDPEYEDLVKQNERLRDMILRGF